MYFVVLFGGGFKHQSFGASNPDVSNCWKTSFLLRLSIFRGELLNFRGVFPEELFDCKSWRALLAGSHLPSNSWCQSF